jgi:hypothetical protein
VAFPGAFFELAPSRWNVRQETGSILGKVVNDKGEPVVDAEVRFVQVGHIVETPPVAESDENGQFVIDGLRPGTYRIHASKIDEGYPYTFSSFYQDDWNLPPYVTVVSDEVTRDVVLHIHKDGWLKGTIVSDSTNQPVNEADITLRRADDPHVFHSTGLNRATKKSAFRILVPTVPFIIEVRALGYQTWTYHEDDAATQRSTLKVERDATKNLTIRLHPSSSR